MVLIVDDTQENLFSLKALLQMHGYDVDTASSGEEALKKVLKTDYSLIILDVQMPDIDGYEVAQTISGYSKTKDIPVLFLSAVSIDKRFIKKGYASGGVDYVTKPFDPDILMLKVKTFSRLQAQKKELSLLNDQLKDEITRRTEAQLELNRMNQTLELKVEERTAELRKANADLESSNVELQQFASVASHDLKEPVRKILSFCDLILEKYTSDPAKAHVYIEKVSAAAERMRNLINDLLDYSRLSVEASFMPVALNEIVAETLVDLEVLIANKNAQVHVSHLPVVEIIPGQMRQVFQNLVSNALKFTREGVPPIIHIDCSTNINPDGTAATVDICIKDNGIGFQDKFSRKIFDIFERLHPKTEYEGTGIGLAIVKKIIEKHNGIVSAEGEENIGATFTIRLPLKQNV